MKVNLICITFFSFVFISSAFAVTPWEEEADPQMKVRQMSQALKGHAVTERQDSFSDEAQKALQKMEFFLRMFDRRPEVQRGGLLIEDGTVYGAMHGGTQEGSLDSGSFRAEGARTNAVLVKGDAGLQRLFLQPIAVMFTKQEFDVVAASDSRFTTLCAEIK